MQTLEFTHSLERIVKDLKIGELVLMLQAWLIGPLAGNPGLPDPDKDRFATLVFDSRSGYDRLSGVPSAHRILQGLRAGEIYEPARMRRILNTVSNTNQVVQLRNNGELYDFFETLRSFLRIDGTCRGLLETEKVGKVDESFAILELQVIDYDGNGVEAARLSRVVLTLMELHMNLSRLLGIQNDVLRFRYFDSGSDLAMGITAAAGLIAVLGPLLLQYWDKVRFRHQETFGKDIEALSKGLEFMGKVQEAVEKQALTEEEARNLKVRVFNGVNDLIGLGVSLPFGESTVDQRQLLIAKRDTKLLGSGQSKGDSDAGSEATGTLPKL